MRFAVRPRAAALGEVAAEARRHVVGKQRTRLGGKLPVYIVYLTAFTRDGELFFGDDLYARDDALAGR